MKYIHPTAIIGKDVIIEEDVSIGPYCTIGLPPEWKGRERDCKGVIIKKGSILTGLVTVDSGADAPTVIGENCYIMKHTYVGHDCIIGNDVTMASGAKVGGHVYVGDKCNLGLNSSIHQRLEIPEGCMIGANAFVGKKSVLRPYRKYVGVPVKDIGSNVRS